MAEKFVVPEADASGRFGAFGGRFVPETLMAPLEELDARVREGAAARRRLPARAARPPDDLRRPADAR